VEAKALLDQVRRPVEHLVQIQEGRHLSTNLVEKRQLRGALPQRLLRLLALGDFFQGFFVQPGTLNSDGRVVGE
jgi:hypothetical protein